MLQLQIVSMIILLTIILLIVSKLTTLGLEDIKRKAFLGLCGFLLSVIICEVVGFGVLLTLAIAILGATALVISD